MITAWNDRTPPVVLVLVSLLVAGSSADAAVMSVEEFVKQKASWKKWVGRRIEIEGRSGAIGIRSMRFLKCPGINFRWTPSVEQRPRAKNRSSFQVSGRLRTDGAKLFFSVERVLKLPSDLERFQKRQPTGAKAGPEDWFALAAWADGRGRFYDDAELVERAQLANRRGVKLLRNRGRSDADRLFAAAAEARKRGLSEMFRIEIVHEALRAMLAAATADGADRDRLAVLVKRITRELPDSREVPGEDPEALRTRYDLSPVAVYDAVSPGERRLLHRVLLAHVLLALIREDEKPGHTNAWELGQRVTREVPERKDVAETYFEAALRRDLDRVERLSAAELEKLAERLRKANRSADADRAIDRWLADRRLKLERDGAGGLIILAELHLALKNDVETAAALLLEADKLNPGNREVSSEIAEQLGLLGYVRRDGQWVKDVEAKPRRPEVAFSSIRIGMSRKELLDENGIPQAISRIAQAGAFSEIWVYGEPGGSRVAVHLRRKRGESSGAVIRWINLRSRR